MAALKWHVDLLLSPITLVKIEQIDDQIVVTLDVGGVIVPAAARQEVEQQARSTGKSPTKAQTQQVIAKHSAFLEGAEYEQATKHAVRILNLLETEAVIWRAAYAATGITEMTTTAHRATIANWFADHWHIADYTPLLNPEVTMTETLFQLAFDRVRKVFLIKGAHKPPCASVGLV